jgi:hypothetical protein
MLGVVLSFNDGGDGILLLIRSGCSSQSRLLLGLVHLTTLILVVGSESIPAIIEPGFLEASRSHAVATVASSSHWLSETSSVVDSLIGSLVVVSSIIPLELPSFPRLVVMVNVALSR